MASVQSSLVMHPINEFGSDAQKERYLPRLGTYFAFPLWLVVVSTSHWLNTDYKTIFRIAKGELIGCFVRPHMFSPALLFIPVYSEFVLTVPPVADCASWS